MLLHTVTKRLQICVDINIEISEVDHYMFTFRIFTLVVDLRVTLTKRRKREGGVLIRAGGLENFLKKNKRGKAY